MTSWSRQGNVNISHSSIGVICGRHETDEKMKRSMTSNSLFGTDNGAGMSERSRQMIFSKVQWSATDSYVTLNVWIGLNNIYTNIALKHKRENRYINVLKRTVKICFFSSPALWSVKKDRHFSVCVFHRPRWWVVWSEWVHCKNRLAPFPGRGCRKR